MRAGSTEGLALHVDEDRQQRAATLLKDVAYIITDSEKRAFKKLETDDEREKFIEDFWRRRDPDPDTEENEYRETHKGN